MRISHQNWTLRDHQPKTRNDYEDVPRKTIPGISTQQMRFFFFSNEQLAVAVNPRQVKSGVLRAKTILDYTVYTTGIFNSVPVSIGLSDQELRILRR